MKKILFSVAVMVMACVSASAQYFSAEKGQQLIYKSVNYEEKEKSESDIKSTVISVENGANGEISARTEDVVKNDAAPDIEVTTYRNYYYDPATDITKVVVMSAEDFKTFVLSMIRQSAAAAGQQISEMDLAELEKSITTKGDLEFEIDPKMAEGTKLPKSSLRLNAGMMSMRANLWEGKMLGQETVTVPTGTYDCVKISYSMVINTPNGNEKRNLVEWYAKGIGLVKSTEVDKKGNVQSCDELIEIK